MTITVPKNSLRLPGIYPGMAEEGEKEVTPEVNDPVSFSVEGVVKSITGNMAEVEVRFVNGERPDATEAKESTKGEPEEMTEDEMSAAAEKADMEEYEE